MEIKTDITQLLKDSIPIWSYFLGGAISAIIGSFLMVFSEILNKYGIVLHQAPSFLLGFIGALWLGGGTYLALYSPLKHLYVIAKELRAEALKEIPKPNNNGDNNIR